MAKKSRVRRRGEMKSRGVFERDVSVYATKESLNDDCERGSSRDRCIAIITQCS